MIKKFSKSEAVELMGVIFRICIFVRFTKTFQYKRGWDMKQFVKCFLPPMKSGTITLYPAATRIGTIFL